MRRLWIALAAYVGLGALAWETLDDRNIRLVTLAILALLTLKTVVHFWRMQQAPE